MKEKIISEISRNYAKALFETAAENNCVEKFTTQLKEISEICTNSSDLTVVMKNSSISTLKKLDIINSIFENKINIKLLNFLKILVEKNRFEELDSIVHYYNEIINKNANKKTVEIISPIELNFENKSNVLFKLEHKLKSEISPIWTVDESIIAGLVFRFEDYVIDTSVRAKLKYMSKAINK